MALLDFIHKRQTSQQQSAANKSQEQKPETAKEMHTRRDAEQKASEKPITPEIKAQADRALATMNKASQHLQPPSAPATPESGGSPQAQMQKQDHQDKTQEALSPTDSAAGKTAVQEKSRGVEEKSSQQRPQTLPRRPPSWER